MATIVISCSIAVIVVVFSGFYYRRRTTGKRRALIVWSVRCAMVILLLCALYEPVFNVRTLTLGPQPITIMIDVSQSMKLFKPDSLINRVVSRLKTAQWAKGLSPAPIEVFAFGDSLRRCIDPSHVSFSDCHSFFPPLSGGNRVDRSRSIVIISDGNWSNLAPPAAALHGKNCWYITLPPFSPRPFLHAEYAVFPSLVAQDSPFTAKIGIRGFKNNAEPVEIRVHEKGRSLGLARLKTPAGHFGDTVDVKLPSPTPGRHCFVVDIVNAPDKLRRQLYRIGSVTTGKYTAAIQRSAPSMDSRFLSLALSSGLEWDLADAGSQRGVDALFILNWDAEARHALARIKPTAVAVFIGCAPCSTGLFPVSDSLTLIATQPDDTLTQSLQRMHLPSVSLVSLPPRSPFTSMTPIMTCTVYKTIAGKREAFQAPFLFSGNSNGTSALCLAARDLWKMEFLPLAVERENENPSFVRCFLACVRRLIDANVNKSFFAFPASPELSDQDSCVFSFDIPPTPAFNNQSQSPATIHFSASSNGIGAADTTLVVHGGNTAMQSLRLKPFPPGVFSFTAAYFCGQTRMVSADTLFVQHSEAENEIQGQNTVMLDQVAAAVAPDDVNGIVENAMIDWQGEKRDTRALSIRFEQSWPLFLAIVCLLAIEWVLRKKTGLDG